MKASEATSCGLPLDQLICSVTQCLVGTCTALHVCSRANEICTRFFRLQYWPGAGAGYMFCANFGFPVVDSSLFSSLYTILQITLWQINSELLFRDLVHASDKQTYAGSTSVPVRTILSAHMLQALTNMLVDRQIQIGDDWQTRSCAQRNYRWTFCSTQRWSKIS